MYQHHRLGDAPVGYCTPGAWEPQYRPLVAPEISGPSTHARALDIMRALDDTEALVKHVQAAAATDTLLALRTVREGCRITLDALSSADPSGATRSMLIFEALVFLLAEVGAWPDHARDVATWPPESDLPMAPALEEQLLTRRRTLADEMLAATTLSDGTLARWFEATLDVAILDRRLGALAMYPLDARHTAAERAGTMSAAVTQAYRDDTRRLAAQAPTLADRLFASRQVAFYDHTDHLAPISPSDAGAA